MNEKLSKVAEIQIANIEYSLGCTREEAISTALEAQHAFEEIEDDDIINWLDTNHKEKLIQWQEKNADGLTDIESN